MKKTSIILSILLIAAFALFAMGSGDDSETPSNQGEGQVQEAASASVDNEKQEEDNTSLGDYSVVIDSCRLATDYEGKDVVIIKYIFGNVSDDDAASFMGTLSCNVYQNGVGLNESYFMNDNANYNTDNQTKEIKMGSTIEVEEAYVLNDTMTPIEVEVSEWISFNDKVITKTFTIAQ